MVYYGNQDLMNRQNESFLSPALSRMPAEALRVVPLSGVEAQIYARLWRCVAERKLRPGTKLNESIIGEVFGVSRTVVRKVLNILEQEGVVHLPQNRGAFIAVLDLSDARSTQEVFAMTVTHLVTQLVHPDVVISDEHRALLDEHIKVQSEFDSSGNHDRALQLRAEFWILLAGVYGNVLLTHLLARLAVRYVLAQSFFDRSGLLSADARFQSLLIKRIAEKESEKALSMIGEFLGLLRKSLITDRESEDVDLRSLLSANGGGARSICIN